jgi:hypothetical protein
MPNLITLLLGPLSSSGGIHVEDLLVSLILFVQAHQLSLPHLLLTPKDPVTSTKTTQIVSPGLRRKPAFERSFFWPSFDPLRPWDASMTSPTLLHPLFHAFLHPKSVRSQVSVALNLCRCAVFTTWRDGFGLCRVTWRSTHDCCADAFRWSIIMERDTLLSLAPAGVIMSLERRIDHECVFAEEPLKHLLRAPVANARSWDDRFSFASRRR